MLRWAAVTKPRRLLSTDDRRRVGNLGGSPCTNQINITTPTNSHAAASPPAPCKLPESRSSMERDVVVSGVGSRSGVGAGMDASGVGSGTGVGAGVDATHSNDVHVPVGDPCSSSSWVHSPESEDPELSIASSHE